MGFGQINELQQGIDTQTTHTESAKQALNTFDDFQKINSPKNQQLLQQIIESSDGNEETIQNGLKDIYKTNPDQKDIQQLLQAIITSGPDFIDQGEITDHRNITKKDHLAQIQRENRENVNRLKRENEELDEEDKQQKEIINTHNEKQEKQEAIINNRKERKEKGNEDLKEINKQKEKGNEDLKEINKQKEKGNEDLKEIKEDLKEQDISTINQVEIMQQRFIIAKQNADKIQSGNSEKFQQAQEKTVSTLQIDESKLQDSPLQRDDIAKLITLQRNPDLWEEDLFFSDSDKQTLEAYLSDGSFENIKKSLGISIGLDNIDDFSDTVLQPQRNREHAEDIRDALGNKEYIKSFGSIGNICTLYQNIIKSNQRKEFAKQNERSKQTQSMIQKAATIGTKTEKSNQEKQRIQSHKEPYSNMYKGLALQSSNIIGQTTMDAYIDTALSGFEGAQHLTVDRESLQYTKTGGMQLHMSYQGRYIGDLSIDSDGTITGPQILTSLDPKINTSFKAFDTTNTVKIGQLSSTQKIFSSLRTQPDRSTIIREAIRRKNNPLAYIKTQEKQHYSSQINAHTRQNQRTADVNIARHIEKIENQAINYKMATFMNLSGSTNQRETHTNNKFLTQENNNHTHKITSILEASRQYHTKRDIDNITQSLEDIYTLMIDNTKTEGSGAITDPIFTGLTHGDPAAIQALTYSNMRHNNHNIMHPSALADYVHHLKSQPNKSYAWEKSPSENMKKFYREDEEQKETNIANLELENALEDIETPNTYTA